MRSKPFKDTLKKWSPYVVGILVIVVAIQTWLLASAYLKDQESQKKSQTSNFHAKLTPLDPFSPWRDDPFKNDLFSRPFGPSRLDPFDNMQSLHERMNSIFDDAFKSFPMNPGLGKGLGTEDISPQIDMKEEQDEIVVKIRLPGADNSNINVNCEDQQLTISGTIDVKREEQSSAGIFQHRQQSSHFTQSIPLPTSVKADEMKTTTENDLIIVTIPKA